MQDALGMILLLLAVVPPVVLSIIELTNPAPERRKRWRPWLLAALVGCICATLVIEYLNNQQVEALSTRLENVDGQGARLQEDLRELLKRNASLLRTNSILEERITDQSNIMRAQTQEIRIHGAELAQVRQELQVSQAEQRQAWERIEGLESEQTQSINGLVRQSGIAFQLAADLKVSETEKQDLQDRKTSLEKELNSALAALGSSRASERRSAKTVFELTRLAEDAIQHIQELENRMAFRESRVARVVSMPQRTPATPANFRLAPQL